MLGDLYLRYVCFKFKSIKMKSTFFAILTGDFHSCIFHNIWATPGKTTCTARPTA